MSEEIDKHVLRKYEIGQRVGKGVSKGTKDKDDGDAATCDVMR
jgi:hypothetical protein